MIKKNIIQFLLIAMLIILSAVFYQKYMISSNTGKKLLEKKIDNKTTNEKLLLDKNNEAANVIENLRYTSNDLFGNTYVINAQSAQVEEGKIDQVKLFEVMAKIIQKDDEVIYINSNFADYNKINNNTIFQKNVNVKYGDQSIDADIINLNFSKNTIKIEENVHYKNNNAKVNADKIEINIETKKLKISMNEQEDEVEIFAKY
ncbi:MAG: LPS export ABC transporter periplasmic protein LptC [Candidatus Pelagibacter sp.]